VGTDIYLRKDVYYVLSLATQNFANFDSSPKAKQRWMSAWYVIYHCAPLSNKRCALSLYISAWAIWRCSYWRVGQCEGLE